MSPWPRPQEADTLEGLRQVQNQSYRSLILFFCCAINSFHVHQIFPHCSLGSSISAIGSVPLNTIPSLSLRNSRSPLCFPPTYHQRRYKRHRPLTRDILRNQEEHCVLHFLKEFHNFSSRFLSSNPKRLWCGSHHILPLFLLCTFLMPFPSHLLTTSAALPHISSTPPSSRVCPAYSVHPHHTASMSTILSSLLHNGPITSHPPLLSPRTVLLSSTVLAS